jgi:hypothetical protein
MDLCFFFLATVIAYRMGARGVWLFAIFMFSWLAFVPWLVLRHERPKREDAELKRTLMIVRAINPAMADKIEVEQAIERTLAAGRTKPARPKRSKGQVALIAAAIVGGLVLIRAIAPLTVPPPEPERAVAIHRPGDTGALPCGALDAMAADLGLPHGSPYETYRRGRALGVCE